METRIVEGSLNCAQHGKIQAEDCSCMRNSSCTGCFIYDSLSDKDLKEKKEENIITYN